MRQEDRTPLETTWEHMSALQSYIGYLEGTLIGLEHTGHEDVTRLVNRARERAEHYKKEIERTK